ncbi:isoflavone 3'-hydroxylase-like [Neltuma alba]|uniref:isoflavone 3'-hydroxylase-like n=1 Tax=Neltuma alba TaxID=207710 RepID=UPI0010A4D208|nr:isoflavone 3'-hydroxylase-like [Prosopis alba]
MSSFLFHYFLLSLAFFFTPKLFLQNKKLKNIPPGPPSVPFIANLHQLKKPLHRAPHRISQRYGQIISLWFGSRLFVVCLVAVRSRCFKKNLVLANRPRFLTGPYVSYQRSPYMTSLHMATTGATSVALR